MARLIALRSRAQRPLAAWLVLVAPAFAACSFFAPSLTDYAKTRGNAGASGTGIAQGGGTAAGMPGFGGDAGSNVTGGAGGGSGGLAEAGEAGAVIGEAGWTGEV